MKSKSITFYRYILSYALVLFLPIVFLFTLFNSFLLDRYKQEIADNSTRLLTQIQENMDTQLEQLISEKIGKAIRVRMILREDAPLQKEKLAMVKVTEDRLRSHIACWRWSRWVHHPSRSWFPATMWNSWRHHRLPHAG